ncbi:hypothetical protein dsx2_0079 [Desulfovibrio sp. X2]|uniref:tetratricopeptide repeat protein n=1 Tax=Desulfovibrio sp. X2 TaxID=941449 RepID=UPI000358B9F8|nr:tetratricopeptide repeat protein [Desulfovibrio sp. X2]EPR43855.1 hypothetical protein dsx2_0079 [Desulfovibrio sp. X2]
MSAKKGSDFSRRDLLFGFVDRIRGREPGEKAVTGVTQESSEADGHFAAGRWSEAVNAYRDVLARESGNEEARVRLGICFYRQGKHTQAVVELGRVLRKRSHNLASLYLGLCHARRGELDKAATAWKAYFEPSRVPLMREINFQLARIETEKEVDSGSVAAAVEEALAAEQG